MIVVTAPSPKPRATVAPISESARAAFVGHLNLEQCALISELVETELWRRGYRRVKFGGRVYQFVEAAVVSNLVTTGADLAEVAASIQEARYLALCDGEALTGRHLHFY